MNVNAGAGRVRVVVSRAPSTTSTTRTLSLIALLVASSLLTADYVLCSPEVATGAACPWALAAGGAGSRSVSLSLARAALAAVRRRAGAVAAAAASALRGDAGGAAAAAAATGGAPGSPPAPSAAAAAASGGSALPVSAVHVLGRGFTCFDNLYLVNGVMWLNAGGEGGAGAPAPRGGSRLGPAWTAVGVREFLAGDGALGDMAELPDDLAAALAGAPAGVLAASRAGVVMNEWKPPGRPMIAFTSHYGHFIEEVESALVLQAAAGLETFATGVCCRCKENFAGEGLPLNRWVMAALWGADWRHCNDFSAHGAWGTRLVPADARAGSALRMETGCLVDRYVAHKDWRTDAVNNCNANIAGAAVQPAVQARVEEQIARFRRSDLIVGSNLTGLADVLGTPLEPAMRAGGDGPLVVIQARKLTTHRAITAESMAALVAYVKSAHATRVLVIQWELLPNTVQLAVAAAADVLMGMQGNGLSHLLWMRRGGAVLELFPHYRHGDGEGTGWTNDWPFLTRLRGMVYRAADVAWGAQNPVAHPIRDEERWLNVFNNELDMARIRPVVDELFGAWRAVRDAAAKAGGIERVDMREHWNPEAWRPESGEEPFLGEAGWHPNHAKRRRAAGGAPVGGE